MAGTPMEEAAKVAPSVRPDPLGRGRRRYRRLLLAGDPGQERGRGGQLGQPERAAGHLERVDEGRERLHAQVLRRNPRNDQPLWPGWGVEFDADRRPAVGTVVSSGTMATPSPASTMASATS